ncbi:A disintegrin and metalloproteinase with thrombospondin motifs 8 [Chanos chanos]|uniref:A disintegrin and metalloproteinase with thrombospondin motifs 8 n=1 Tax=Chanos chanos TaxID=29144 RepID=A0A6J2VPL9_CHACN|nr:A disintegrin and metalloproteinase with thrombospondin motifs 8-like [Chanos chanos]
MRSWWCFVVLVVCLSDQTFSQSFEFEEIVPVKISGRSSRRVSKRSEEQPSFRLTAFGRDFTLHLYPDNSFLAPTLQIKRIKTKEFSKTDRTADSQDSLHLPVIDSERINQTDEADGDIRRCFYTGTVDFSEDSVVAVSLCHGILGTFITGGDEYFIEPKLFGTGTNKGLAEQLHVVKRRNSTERQNDSKRLLTEMSGGDYKGYGLFIQNTHLLQDKAAGQKPLRHRRFVSTPRFIETLVVADSSLVQFYGDDVKHHVLTLMSVVAQIYKHPSVKNSVNVVVVKMLLVEDEDMGPSISSNGGVALRNFCSWQQLFNPTSQRHPEHYDTAVLFTREDICGHQSCDTLGVADVGTMCDSKKSCSVIEDNGLQAAFTAAHELGHVLSMPHDDSKICERLFGPIGKHHVMAPVFVHLNKTSPWSACSAFYVTEFFDKGHGDCLLDRPEEFLPLPKELPGMTYSLDQQCQQIFGEEFAHCPNISDSDVCSQLWCKKDGQSLCTTRNGSLPWADGTACAPNRACLNSACMPAEEVFRPREPVNGDWGEWGPWQECSRTCGGGIMFSYRECTNPVPQNGGKYCEGQRVRYQSCNTPACADKHGKSFREEQCEKYNSYNYLDIHGNVKRWIPKYAGVPPRDRCKLFCRARGSSEFKVFESKVIDGTTCGPDTTSICVQGQCIKAGCDKEIGSNKKLDKCGVCGGNGLSCRKISGSFNKAFYGYNDIVTIPSGATNIDIKQRSHRGIKHDGYYLAVKKEDDYSKRVYQGVRVKHTVKDLLAEKRSRQTNGPRYSGTSTPQSPFVQMPGSHMLPSYYGMRRSFLSDSEFCSSNKPFSAEVYSSSLAGKPFSCDTASMSGYSSLIDSYYPDSFGEYRSTAFTSGGGTIFSPSALSSLLPSLPAESSYFSLKESWEQAGTEAMGQVEALCEDNLANMHVSSSLNNPESVSPTQYRSSSRGSCISTPQPYSLHSLEDVHYHTPYQSTGSFVCPPYMTVSTDSLPKIPPLTSEEPEITTPVLSDSLSWGKEDPGSAWSPYELRRTF